MYKKLAMLSMGLMSFGLIKSNLDDQESLKRTSTFNDGTSFFEFEDKFRTKYQHLQIPEIEFQKSALFDAAYNPYENKIKHNQLSDELLKNQSCSEWILLHETGHAQKPEIVKNINLGVLFLGVITSFAWGAHKTKPYKNIFTKISSKALATVGVPITFFCAARKLEERRADNFANKHADKEALIAQINDFKSLKENELKSYKRIKTGSPFLGRLVYPFTFGDPIHPTINSRIRKIEKALSSRFGVEV